MCRDHRILSRTKTSTQRISLGTLGVVLPVIVAVVAACGGSADGPPEGADAAAAAEGKQISVTAGCAGCHGANGEGGTGPAWVGLLGARVELADGTVVTADESYIAMSIEDPASQTVTGYSSAMPVNELSDEDIAKVVAYISSLD